MAHLAGNVSRDDEILYSLSALSSLSKDQLNDLCSYYGLVGGGKREDALSRLINHGERLLHTGTTVATDGHERSPQHPLFPSTFSYNPAAPQTSSLDTFNPLKTTSPPSPVERMTISRSDTTKSIRPTIRPTISGGISGTRVSSRRSFRLDTFLRPREDLTASVPFEELAGRGKGTSTGMGKLGGGDETWDVIDAGDTSTQTVGGDGVVHERDITFDHLGRRITSALATDATPPAPADPEHAELRPVVTRNISHSQTWNGRGARRAMDAEDRIGGSLGWKSAVNGGNGYAVDEGADEFGRKGLGGTTLGRKSLNSLRNMASHISLRRAATSSSTGLSRRASTNILGRKPSSATFASTSLSSHPCRQDTARSGTNQTRSTPSRCLAPFRSAFADPGKAEASPAKKDEHDDMYGVEELANPPSPAPTETVGVARRHRDSVMNGPSTIRLISHGPVAIVGAGGADETPKATGKGGLRKGASIPNMFGSGAEHPQIDSPSVPKLFPLRLSTFPMDDSLSLASRRSSVCSEQDSATFEVVMDAPPAPAIPAGSTHATKESDPSEPIKSPVFPGGFPSTPSRQQPFVFGSPAHSLSNADFSASTDSLLRDLGGKLGGTLKLKGLLNLDTVQADTRPSGKMTYEELKKAAAEWEAGMLAQSAIGRSGPKGDRYEQAHQRQFGKMDSIAKKRVPSGNAAKPLPRLPLDREALVPEAKAYKRKIQAEDVIPESQTVRTDRTKKARVDSAVMPSFARAQGSPRRASGRQQQDQNGGAQRGIVGAVTGQIAAFAKRLSSGPEILLREDSDTKPTTVPGGYAISLDMGSKPGSMASRTLQRKTSGLPRLAAGDRAGPNKLKKVSSTPVLGSTKPGSRLYARGETDRTNLPGQHRLVSKGSTASKLSMAPEHKKSSRPAPAMPGTLMAERKVEEARRHMIGPSAGAPRRKALPTFTEEAGIGIAGKANLARNLPVLEAQCSESADGIERMTPSLFVDLASSDLGIKGHRSIPPPRIKVGDNETSSKYLLGGAPKPKLKQPGHHLAHSARHKTGSPSRKSVLAAGGLKHKTSKAALEMSRRQHGMTEQRRREQAEKGLQAELGM